MRAELQSSQAAGEPRDHAARDDLAARVRFFFFSRAVEFAVDEKHRSVREVWRYGDSDGERLFAGFQGGAIRMPKTGNTFISYGGICSVEGKPSNEPERADIRARLIEVTPERDIVFDLSIGGAPHDPKSLSIFRSELVQPWMLHCYDPAALRAEPSLHGSWA